MGVSERLDEQQKPCFFLGLSRASVQSSDLIAFTNWLRLGLLPLRRMLR
jgi:hypothetical protein